MSGARCGWLCWGGWGELSTLFSLVMSLLLQITADSASWVPVVFQFGGKEPPKLPFKLVRPSSLGSLMVSSAIEAGLWRGEMAEPGFFMLELHLVPGSHSFQLLTNVSAAQSA